MPLTRRTEPHTNYFIEWFRNLEEYADYYWIKKRDWYKKKSDGKWTLIYFREPKHWSKRWWRRRKVYVNTYEILKVLHHKWLFDLYDFKWRYLTHMLDKDKNRWLKLPSMSEPVREKITERLLPEVLNIVEEYGNRSDRRKAEGIYTLLKDFEQQPEWWHDSMPVK